MWGALNELSADRIGHGVRSVEDETLVRHLAAHRIPLDMSITSNVRTGIVASLAKHPIRRLFEAGVPITINTDDPAMFNTDLNREYLIAHKHLGFTVEELRKINRDAISASFVDNPRKAELLRALE